jgi:alpha-glucosidase
MKDILTFWLGKGVDGFRVAAVSHLFEDSAMRDEPLSNKTDDPNEYGYTEHVYTKDLVRIFAKFFEFAITKFKKLF